MNFETFFTPALLTLMFLFVWRGKGKRETNMFCVGLTATIIVARFNASPADALMAGGLWCIIVGILACFMPQKSIGQVPSEDRS